MTLKPKLVKQNVGPNLKSWMEYANEHVQLVKKILMIFVEMVCDQPLLRKTNVMMEMWMILMDVQVNA